MARKLPSPTDIVAEEPRELPGTVRVGLVDDDPKHLSELKHGLQALGVPIEIETYGNSLEALTIVPRTKPDILIMEARLPKMSGIECTRGIKAILPKIGIIILTSSRQNYHLVRALTAGADGYLLKPSNAQTCWDAIQEVCKGRSVLSNDAVQVLVASYRRKRGQWTSEKGLTCREHEIMTLLLQGYRDKEIARALRVGIGTVHTHTNRMFKKMGVGSRTEAIRRYLTD